MKKINFYTNEELLARLNAESKESGVPMSEIIRRAIDAWLQQKEKK